MWELIRLYVLLFVCLVENFDTSFPRQYTDIPVWYSLSS